MTPPSHTSPVISHGISTIDNTTLVSIWPAISPRIGRSPRNEMVMNSTVSTIWLTTLAIIPRSHTSLPAPCDSRAKISTLSVCDVP